MTHSLCKDERLWGERVISNLFKYGHSFFLSPYKAVWIKIPEAASFSSRFGVSVSKRCFKRAVKRNLMKRRTREVFRTNKQILNAAVKDGTQIHLMVIYTSDRLLPFVDLENSMKKILQRIAQKYVESI
jgi:ribonuclease P protein component